MEEIVIDFLLSENSDRLSHTKYGKDSQQLIAAVHCQSMEGQLEVLGNPSSMPKRFPVQMTVDPFQLLTNTEYV